MYYNVQCLNGHVSTVLLGSNLEKRCKERAEQGYLDALCLTAEECPDCIAEHEEFQRREALLDLGQ